MTSNTGWPSAGELEITRRISLVAVCCSNASARLFSRSRTLAVPLLGALRLTKSLASTLLAGFQRLPPVASFNDLIRAPQQRRRDHEAERPGGLEVDHQLVLGRLFDWEFRGLGALENLVHVGGGAPKQIGKVRSIGHKAPGIDKLPPWVHCRQPVLCPQVNKASSPTKKHGPNQHSKSTRTALGHVLKGPSKTLRPCGLKKFNPAPQ